MSRKYNACVEAIGKEVTCIYISDCFLSVEVDPNSQMRKMFVYEQENFVNIVMGNW